MSYQVKNGFNLSTQLTTSVATYYTAGTGVFARIGAFTITNQNALLGSNATYSVYIVENGGTASAANCIINANTVVAGKSDPGAYVILGQVIPPGATIQMVASANTTLSVFCGLTELVS